MTPDGKKGTHVAKNDADPSIELLESAVLPPDGQTNFYLKLSRTVRRELSYKDLPLTLLSLALAIFTTALFLRAYEGAWFQGIEFIASCVVSSTMIVLGGAIYIVELIVLGPRHELVKVLTQAPKELRGQSEATHEAPMVTSSSSSGNGPAWGSSMGRV